MYLKGSVMVSSWVILCFLAPMMLKIAGVTLLDFAVIIILLLNFCWFLKQGFRFRFISTIDRSLLGFAAIMVLSYAVNALSPYEDQKAFVASRGLSADFLFLRLTLYGLVTILMILVSYRMVAEQVRKPEQIETVIRVLALSGLVNAIITNGYWLLTTGGSFARYNFDPPIESSQGIHFNFMSLTFMIALTLLLSFKNSRKQKLLLVSTLAMTFFSMLTVMVRQGWVSFIFILFYYIYTIRFDLSKKVRRRILTVSILVGLTLFAVVAVMFRAQIIAMFVELFTVSGSDDDQGSWLMRFALMRHGLDVFLDHLLLGVGYGHYPSYSTVPIFVSGVRTYVSSPHNGLVTIAAETGIAGLFLFVAISWNLLRESRSTFHAVQHRPMRLLAGTIHAFLLVAVISQLFSNSILIPLPTERTMMQGGFVLWILVGLMSSVKRHYGMVKS